MTKIIQTLILGDEKRQQNSYSTCFLWKKWRTLSTSLFWDPTPWRWHWQQWEWWTFCAIDHKKSVKQRAREDNMQNNIFQYNSYLTTQIIDKTVIIIMWLVFHFLFFVILDICKSTMELLKLYYFFFLSDFCDNRIARIQNTALLVLHCNLFYFASATFCQSFLWIKLRNQPIRSLQLKWKDLPYIRLFLWEKYFSFKW